jgi:hypothetical protein
MCDHHTCKAGSLTNMHVQSQPKQHHPFVPIKEAPHKIVTEEGRKLAYR